MKVALGFKSHSGWAALVVIGISGTSYEVVNRRRIELIEDGELWAKMPYHAAEGLARDEADAIVENGIRSAHRVAHARMKEIQESLVQDGHEIAACAVITPSPMPDWSINEILAVHFRMHKAEGVLFPDAICRAAGKCGLRLVTIREKEIAEHIESSLGITTDMQATRISDLGKSIGPPWGKDQKVAATAALIALAESSSNKIN